MPKIAKKEKRPVAKIDFKPYGAAIKAGRTKQKESRNKAADALFISPRYLANIENKGQHPSVQVFLELMSRYHISVDQILHGETMEGKSTERMQFETLLDELTDAEIKILTATAQAFPCAHPAGFLHSLWRARQQTCFFRCQRRNRFE